MRLEELPPKLQEQAKIKLGLQERKSKYNAIKTEVDGIKFDSKAEAEYYANLKLLERAGIIHDLKLQPRFLLQDGFTYHGHKERKIEYVADFEYTMNGERIVVDVKGLKTQVYRIKRKLFLKQYGDSVTFKELNNVKANQSR